MTTPRILTLLLVSIIFSSTSLAQTTLRKLWRSNRYSPAPLPTEWQAPGGPQDRDVAAFQQFAFPRMSIRAVVERFGTPDRYLVSRRRDDLDFLIYDLPRGYAVALYVSRPPRDQFAAAVIIDAREEQVRLVK
jgi:hypothetical protein